mgnify:CR=1 FL=1
MNKNYRLTVHVTDVQKVDAQTGKYLIHYLLWLKIKTKLIEN